MARSPVTRLLVHFFASSFYHRWFDYSRGRNVKKGKRKKEKKKKMWKRSWPWYEHVPEKIRIPLVHFHRDNLHRNLESSPIEPASYKERFISESRPTPTSATLLSDAREFYKGTFPFLFFSFFLFHCCKSNDTITRYARCNNHK